MTEKHDKYSVDRSQAVVPAGFWEGNSSGTLQIGMQTKTDIGIIFDKYPASKKEGFNVTAKDDLEKKGITCKLYEEYMLPDGISRENLNNFCNNPFRFDEKDTIDDMKQIWHALTILNPQLKHIYVGRKPWHYRHAIYGVASLYKPRDINFYLNIHLTGSNEESQEIQNKVTKLLQENGYKSGLGFIIGPESYKELESYFHNIKTTST